MSGFSHFGVIGVGGQVFMNFAEDSYHVAVILFANMKIIIQPRRGIFLAPHIFLVILEPGGLVAPVHIYLQCKGYMEIIFTVSLSTSVLQSLHGFLIVVDDLILMETVGILGDDTGCMFIIPPV